MECLSEENGFSQKLARIPRDNFASVEPCYTYIRLPHFNNPNRTDHARLLNCPRPRNQHQLRQDACGADIQTAKRCSWRLTNSHCQFRHIGGCAVTLDFGDDQVLLLYRRIREQAYSRLLGRYKWFRKRDAETVRMIAMYVDYGYPADPSSLDFLTSFQPGKRCIMQEKGKSFGTRINATLFLTGFIALWAIFACFIVTSTMSHFRMMRKRRSRYALALRVAEIARFARRNVGDIQGESLFVKLHLDVPHLTVSGVAENCGIWSVRDVLAANDDTEERGGN